MQPFRASNFCRRSRSCGFTLVEALAALLVLAFGMLAVAALQTALAHSADVARQRSEATRLASAKIEELRAFQQLPAASGVAAYADIVSGYDVPATSSNTVYERDWAVADDPARMQKLLRVTVRWLDRLQDAAGPGPRQSVVLASVIAGADPKDAGALAGAPTPAHDLQPAHGLPPIPTIGKDLGDGRSAIQLPSGNAYIVYSHASHAVVARCSGSVTAATEASTVCREPLNALVVAGFISGLPGGTFRGDAIGFDSDTQAQAVRLAFASGYSAAAQPECHVARVPADGAYPRVPGAPAPARYVAGHYAYVCLVQPAADGRWSGRLQVSRVDPSLMRSNDAICRLSWDQDGSGAIDSNREHPDPYVSVGEALHAQNFVWIERADASTASPCPAAATVNGVAVGYARVNLIE